MDKTSQTKDIYEDSTKLALVLIILIGLIVFGLVLVAFEVGTISSAIQLYEKQANRY